MEITEEITIIGRITGPLILRHAAVASHKTHKVVQLTDQKIPF